MTGAIVDTGQLAQVVAYSLLAGVGIAVVFGLGVTSAAGLLDALRDRRTGAAVGWGAVAFLCALATLGGIVVGIAVEASG